MKFADLHQIAANADTAERNAKRLLESEAAIAKHRREIKTEEDPYESLVAVMRYDSHPFTRSTAIKAALGAFLPDILLLAELSLQGQARDYSVRARVLRAQVDAFLGEPDPPSSDKAVVS